MTSNLAILRKAKGLSQRDLSRVTGISVRTIQAYECGARDISLISLKSALIICAALDCEPIDLVI